jgi:hypothetical protein
MAVETIDEARHRVLRMGPRDALKRRRSSVYGGELDMLTLVWTRRRNSTVEFTLQRDGNSTLVRLRHFGLCDSAADAHRLEELRVAEAQGRGGRQGARPYLPE